jgi:hypothetical protein
VTIVLILLTLNQKKGRKKNGLIVICILLYLQEKYPMSFDKQKQSVFFIKNIKREKHIFLSSRIKKAYR